MSANQGKPQFLRGNFKAKGEISADIKKDDLTDKFEKEALKRLGGSICFVSKKKFLYGMDDEQKST